MQGEKAKEHAHTTFSPAAMAHPTKELLAHMPHAARSAMHTSMLALASWPSHPPAIISPLKAISALKR